MRYSRDIRFLVENNLISKDSFFDYTDTPNEELFSMFFNFCRETLDVQKFAELAKPSFFYFKNDTTLNATASSFNRINLISINSGLLVWAKNNLYNNEILSHIIQKNLPNVTSKFDVSISELNYQIATQFTFYHELGHILQFSKKNLEFNFQENCDDIEYDYLNHTLEMNADSFASIVVATHLIQYFKRVFEDEIDYESFFSGIVIAGICLFSYFIKLSSNRTEIYFYEKSHPHPYNRLFNSLIHILNYMSQSQYLKEKEISFNMGEIGKTVVDLYLLFEKNNIFDTQFDQIFKDAFMKQEKVIEYINDLNMFKTTEFYNAIDIWNNTMGDGTIT